jgi:hypothetical protein
MLGNDPVDNRFQSLMITGKIFTKKAESFLILLLNLVW